jgi:acetyltransferase/esterase
MLNIACHRVSILPMNAEGPLYRTAGSGPPLLLIHGSGGDLDSYSRIEAQLAATHRVISYQRRITSTNSTTALPSPLTLDEHVRDALDVLAACDANAAYVLGSSAGAVIGLCLLSSNPESVLGLVAHEPPLIAVLDDFADLRDRFDRVLTTEAEQGLEAACIAFFNATGILGTPPGPFTEHVAKAVAARPVPPIREIHPVLDYVPDMSALKAQRHKLVLATGTLYSDSMPARATHRLAGMLDLMPKVLPGNHFGYMDFANENDPNKFADIIVKAISELGRQT